MTKKPDGGPAFPQLNVEACERDGHGDLIEPFTSSEGGMTLRDWFAGMALQGWLSTCGAAFPDRPTGIARNCYAMADAMLKARSE